MPQPKPARFVRFSASPAPATWFAPHALQDSSCTKSAASSHVLPTQPCTSPTKNQACVSWPAQYPSTDRIQPSCANWHVQLWPTPRKLPGYAQHVQQDVTPAMLWAATLVMAAIPSWLQLWPATNTATPPMPILIMAPATVSVLMEVIYLLILWPAWPALCLAALAVVLLEIVRHVLRAIITLASA